MSLLLDNEFTLLCRGYSSDETDNAVTIFKIITDYNYTFSPVEFKNLFNVELGEKVVLPIESFLSSSWFIRSKPVRDTPIKVKTELFRDTELLYEHSDDSMTIRKGNRRLRISSRMFGLTITKSGLYNYRVTVLTHTDEELAHGSYNFDVTLQLAKKQQDTTSTAG